MAKGFDSQFENSALSETSVKPGLFHLSLDILFQPDSETLNEKKKYLELALKEEHSTTHLVLKNLIAMINYKLPRRHNEVRKILEHIKNKHPEHLNTLANLEIVYRELHRQKDAEICKIAKDKIVQSQDTKHKELQATCVLEQGYALIFGDVSHHEGAANQKLKDSLQILKTEYINSLGDRKEHLARAIRNTEQACASVTGSMQCKRPQEQMQRQTDSIGKFIYGIKLLEQIGKEKTIEYSVWKFFLGMTYNRFDYSVSQEEETVDKNKRRQDLCGQVLQYFWDTILSLEHNSNTKLFTARSYAYIGHLVTSRGDLLNDLISTTPFKCFKDPKFKRLIENPESCLKYAVKLQPKDSVVLTRYGRSLRNMSMSLPEASDRKWNMLCNAYEKLTKSINVMPHNNWFAYVTRMQAARDLGLLEHKYAKDRFAKTGMDRAKDLLRKARLDGINCFNTKSTQTDLCILAKICQMLGKFPNVHRWGPRFVTDKEYVHEAVIYLNYASQIGGFVSWNVAYALGTCLYEIEEYRTAIEWMKHAMYLSRDAGNSTCLTRIGEYILAFYDNVVKDGEEKPEYLLEELKYVIRLGKSKCSEIVPSINSLCKYQKRGMLTFIQYLVTAPKRTDDVIRDFVAACLNALQLTAENATTKKTICSLKDRLEQMPQTISNSDEDLPRNNIYTRPNIVMPFSVDSSVQPRRYTYDFFISHSNANKDWVKGYLLHQLETKLRDDDIAFKGCIADRDFTPGEPIITNIVNAVENSNMIIFVITPEFIGSRWCDFEVDQALSDSLNKKKDNCVIPILLEEVNLEIDKLSHITYLNLTDKSKQISEQIMKLKRALMPDELISERY